MDPVSRAGLAPSGLPPRPRPPSAPDAPPVHDAFVAGEVRPEGRRREPGARRPDLVHPGTADEFRHPLREILGRLPASLVQAVADEGYVLHVVDSQGIHPLTLEVEEVDPAEVLADPVVEERAWDRPLSLREVARERGADRPDLEAELVGVLLRLNPDLAVLADCPEETPVPPGLPLRVPRCRYWQGRRLSPAAWDFLTGPRESAVAGLVTHGRVPGLLGEANRIILWDPVFRRGDGLTDWYVLHEMGHTADFCYAFRRPAEWRSWRERVAAAHGAASPPFTRYAGESPVEYLAEGFAAWATPPGHRREGTVEPGTLAAQRHALDRDALERSDPALAALIAEAVEAVAGRRA